MRQLVLTVPLGESELASDALWGLGVVAIEERRTGDVVELWTSLGEVTALPDLAWPARFVEVDPSVADTWRQHARPVHVSPTLVVCPSWVDHEALPNEVVLRIEPGSTFGMGDHPTTVLCLRAVERLVPRGGEVLDVGCGSGVLAVAALRLGAARAVAVDIAPAAVPVTEANAADNGVHVEVSTTALELVEGTYSLVLANILAPALIDLAPHLRRVTAPTGSLVVSGILAAAHQHVLDALAPMVAVAHEDLDGWTAVVLRHGSDT